MLELNFKQRSEEINKVEKKAKDKLNKSEKFD